LISLLIALPLYIFPAFLNTTACFQPARRCIDPSSEKDLKRVTGRLRVRFEAEEGGTTGAIVFANPLDGMNDLMVLRATRKR
jgi:hypothetical protein